MPGRVDNWVHEDADSRKEQPGVYTEINDAAEQRTTSKMQGILEPLINLSEAPHDTSPKSFGDVSCGDRENAPQGPKCQHALGSSPRGHVGMVLEIENDFPPDARVEREAMALVDAGYELFLLCKKYKPSLPDEEIYKKIHIIRIDPSTISYKWQIPMTSLNIKTGFLYRGLFKSVWKHLTGGVENNWHYLIDCFIKKYRIDILHVHDLKLLKSSLAAAKKKDKPLRVVADLHENYPALVGRMTELRKGKRKGLKKQQWWEKLERSTLHQANKIIVVVEEARDRILEYPTVGEKDVSIVRNVVDSRKFLSPDIEDLSEDKIALLKERFVLCYVGHINSMHRGIHTVIEALPDLVEKIPNIMFIGVGGKRKEYFNTVLQPLIEKHALAPYVHFTGYQNEIRFVPYIKRADICICPHTQTYITDTTFPNKIFLYSLFKKPMVVSSCLPLVRYIRETESGLLFQSGDHEDLSEVILKLYNDPDLCRQLGTNGYKWVSDRYCWDKEKQNLLEVYETL